MKEKFNLTEQAKNGRNGVQLVYVLDCIRNSGRASDEGKVFANDKEALQFFFDCFNAEFNHTYNKRCFPCLADRIDAKSSRIEKFSIVWAENFDKETDERKAILKNYDYYLTAAEEVAKAIENYKNLPFRFRKNIEFDEKFYLS